MILNTEEIASRLLNLRRSLGMSRNSLAKACNIPAVTIKSWENGTAAVRLNNLENYLKEFEQLGCSATAEWVMHGTGTVPEECSTSSSFNCNNNLGEVDASHMIELLSETSNLFYCLDNDERLLYINSDFLFLLGTSGNLDRSITPGVAFKKLCSDDIYNICRKHLSLCQKGRKQRFSYTINNQYSKHQCDVDMLYWPLLKSQSSNTIGTLGFVANKLADN